MDIAYHYFALDPRPSEEALTLAQALPIVRRTFERVEENESEATDNANRRHRVLVACNAPREVLALYENPCVTRVRASTSESEGYFIEFDLWDKQGIMVYPHPDENRLDLCEALSQRLAEALNYTLAVEEYD